MPAGASSNVAHAAVTDHRILKRLDSGMKPKRALLPDEFALVPYPPGPHAPSVEERDRDWAIALANLVSHGGTPTGQLGLADDKLENALRRWPGDSPTWLARSKLLSRLIDKTHAMEAAEAAVRAAPNSELALIQLASMAGMAEKYTLAATTADKLIAINPSAHDHRVTRAGAEMLLRQWEKAEADYRAAIKINPLDPNARMLLAVCLFRRGDPAGARREFELALVLMPNATARKSLSDSYRQLTR
jgi:tetratricopeptide (TPR) repeat protein